MDRDRWLAERREASGREYTSEAPTYDDGYDPASEVHRRYVAALIERTPAGGAILDAACGTGPYVAMILETGRSVVGVDQSEGMLTRAKEKHPGTRFERCGLQEIGFDGGYDGVMCVDAMEHVPPEEWPTVLGNFRRALVDGGHCYLTVELVTDDAALERAYDDATGKGLPVVPGEVISRMSGGYHFYPASAQVDGWLRAAGLAIVDEEVEWFDTYGYRHLLTNLVPFERT